jgi:hypothetical protein
MIHEYNVYNRCYDADIIHIIMCLQCSTDYAKIVAIVEDIVHDIVF